MEKILTVAIMFAGMSMFAASYQAKIMINGAGDGVKLANVSCSEGGSLKNADWFKDAQKDNNEKIIIASFPAGQEWKKGEFTFKPEKDGKVTLQLLAWASDDNGKTINGWVLIDDITVVGITLENGNFEEDNSNWRLKVKPDYKSEIVEGAGHDSNNAVKISNECPADYSKTILVKAGQEIKVSYWYKIAP